LNGTRITCPWHEAEFDLTCGKALTPPARKDLACYPVQINGNEIQIQKPVAERA